MSLRVREVYSGALLTAYELIRPDGVVYRAELVNPGGVGLPVWRIVSTTDRNGNQLQYAYGRFGTLGIVRLTQITHNRNPSQPVVMFTWSADAHLQRITSLPGLSAADPYTDTPRSYERWIDLTITGNELKQVRENTHAVAVDGVNPYRETSYTYDSDRLLRSVRDPRLNLTELGYTPRNGQFLLTSAKDRGNNVWTWSYGTPDPTTDERTTIARTPLANGTDATDTRYRISGRKPVSVTDRRIAGGNILEIRDAGATAGPVVTSYIWTANRLTTSADGTGATTSYEYDDLGSLTKVTEPPPNSTTFENNQNAPGLAWMAPVESVLEYRYPESFRLSPTCDPAATPRGYCYAAAEMVRARYAPNANQTRLTDFQHTATGNLERVIERGPSFWPFSPSTTPPGTGDRATSFTYYSRGGIRKIDGPRTDIADVTVWGNDSSSDPYGGYDRTGMPALVTDAAGKTRSSAYTPYGVVGKTTDRDGKTTRYRYDERDNLTAVVDPLGKLTKHVYDANDNRIKDIRHRGSRELQTIRTYDENDRLKVTSEPGPTANDARSESSIEWNADGTRHKDVERDGHVVTYSYWPNRSLRSEEEAVADAGIARTDYEYDGAGRVSRTTSPATNSTGDRPIEEIQYTPAGDPGIVYTTSSLGSSPQTLSITRTYYNAHREPIEVRGPRKDVLNNDQRTTYKYDVFGQETEACSYLDGSTCLPSQRSYDLAGNETSTSQPSGTTASPSTLTSVYTFDALNRLASQTADPVNPGHTVNYEYNGEGQQTKRIDRKDGTAVRTTTNAYNSDGTRKTTESVDNVANTTMSTCNYLSEADPAAGYDDDGNLLYTRTVNGTCASGTIIRSVSLEWDDRNWLKSTTQGVRNPAGSTVSRTQAYTYNGAGSRTSLTYDGQAVTYTPFPGGWTDQLSNGAGQTASFDYFASGAPKSARYGTNVISNLDYKPDGMPAALNISVGDTNVRSHNTILYDAGSLRTSENISIRNPDGSTSAGLATYGYDLAGRLTGYTAAFPQRPSDTIRPQTMFTLDRGGNILTEVTSVGVERSRATSTYPNGRLATRATTTEADLAGGTPRTEVNESFAYDGLGNETGQETATTTRPTTGSATTITTSTATAYDPAGYTRSVDESDTSKADVAYVYDTSDRVISRTETKSGVAATTLYFYWGTGGALAEETDGAGNTKVRYMVDAGDEPIGHRSYQLTASGNRDLTDTSGLFTWLLHDLSGNVATKIQQDTGAVVEQAAFDPYGRPEPGGSKRATTGSAAKAQSSLGFQGAITDTATGGVLLGARQYDPTSARFTTPDTFVAGELDLELGTDSLTGNRYLFAAANPVAFYEDGHWPKIKVPNPVKSVVKTVKKAAKKAVPALAFVPVVSTAIDVVSAATGRDWLDGGRKLSGAERLMYLGGAGLDVVTGGAGGRAIKAARFAAKNIDKAKPLAKAVKAADKAAEACSINSFVPGTGVLLADGQAVPIETVDVGDLVIATDVSTGETRERPVAALIRGTGPKQLVHIQVGSDLVTATTGHPLWVIGAGWVDAGQVKVGDALGTPGGGSTIVTSVSLKWAPTATVYNLTVDGFHTYYVGTADEALLAHNCVQQNRRLGRALEDRIAGQFERAGYDVARGKGTSFPTEFGRRYHDMLLLGKDGQTFAKPVAVEVKLGKSRYLRSQRLKDAWLRDRRVVSKTIVVRRF